MGCCKKHDCCKRKGRKSNQEKAYDAVESVVDIGNSENITCGGKPMKTLFKLLFKLIWKLLILTGAICGVAFLMNKFAPEVMDALTDWLKERRDD